MSGASIEAREFLSECCMPAFAAGPMYGAVAALRFLLFELQPLGALLVLIPVGAIVYVLVMALNSRRHLVSAGNFARSFVSNNSAA